MTTKPVLGYWGIRGLAQPIRLLLEYTGTEFEDKYYKCGPAPDYDKSSWFDIKPTLGFDFPNLPYYIDGDKKITQSNAIMRYIARKHNLCGETEEEKIRVDLLENQLSDFRMNFVKLCYNPDFDTLRASYLDQLPAQIKSFSKFLGDQKWFSGNSITFPDFIMYEMLDQHKIFAPDCLKDTPNLQEFLHRFEALKPIKEYMNSSRFLKAPLNNKIAKFGNE